MMKNGEFFKKKLVNEVNIVLDTVEFYTTEYYTRVIESVWRVRITRLIGSIRKLNFARFIGIISN